MMTMICHFEAPLDRLVKPCFHNLNLLLHLSIFRDNQSSGRSSRGTDDFV